MTTLLQHQRTTPAPQQHTKAKMTTPTTNPPPQEEGGGGAYELSYKISADHSLGNPPVEIPVENTMANDNSFAAVHWPKVARLQIWDSRIEAANAAEEGLFPCRNRYGALADDPDDKWGYGFRDPSDGLVKGVWLEASGTRVGFLLDEATFKVFAFVSEITQKAPEEEELRGSV
jgi:nicotinamidase-related amidase